MKFNYTEDMIRQLEEIRGNKVEFRKLRRKFRKQLGHPEVVKGDDCESESEVKVFSDGKKLEEVKGLGNIEVVTQSRVYTTDSGDSITVVS